MTTLPAPDHSHRLADGRRLAFDDRGDDRGNGSEVMLYLHGTPDTRVARHPDDEIANRSGFRVIATDRPGLGGSDPDPTSTPASIADDHAHLLDDLGIDHVHVVAWSAGAIFATALAGSHPDRIASLTLIAPLIPRDAYSTPGITDGAGAGRTMFADMAIEMDPDEAGRELAPWLVPVGVTEDLAREHLAESIKAVAAIPGAAERLVAALVGSVAQGMTGMEREITAQAIPLGGMLDSVACPVVIHFAHNDDVCPPAMARWYADKLGSSQVRVVEHRGVGHEIGMTAWPEIVSQIPAS